MSENNKKILLIAMHQMNIGGAQRVMLNLANNISKKGYKIPYVCSMQDYWVIDQDVIIHDLNSSRVIKGLFKYFSVIAQLIRILY